MEYFVDIDMTICITPDGPNGPDYDSAIPHQQNIDYINHLYEERHVITYWTSRGALTGQDWTTLTKNQLQTWGCKYHHLRMDKPFYDRIIDDKAVKLLDVI